MPDAEPDTAPDADTDHLNYFHQLETLIPWNPIVDDDSATLAAQALYGLVARRTPEALGDSLAELHALTSLIHQLHAWLTTTTADAYDQHHTPQHILAQLVGPAPQPDSQPDTPTINPASPGAPHAPGNAPRR